MVNEAGACREEKGRAFFEWIFPTATLGWANLCLYRRASGDGPLAETALGKNGGEERRRRGGKRKGREEVELERLGEGQHNLKRREWGVWFAFDWDSACLPTLPSRAGCSGCRSDASAHWCIYTLFILL
jgi:hypothetical protein